MLISPTSRPCCTSWPSYKIDKCNKTLLETRKSSVNMECRFPDKREEIKLNPETTDATETVCSWRTLVWRQAACSQNYLRGRIKTFCHLTYLSPTLHRKFPELQSHYIVASSSSTSKSIVGSLKQVWPSSLNAQFWILVPNPLVVFFSAHISLCAFPTIWTPGAG